MRKAYLFPALVVVLGFSLLILPNPSLAQVAVGISVRIGPPPLPVYAQPICPGPDFIWAPGYWAWGPYGYYWVPGTWVLAPEPGLYWTPGWWGYDDDGDDYVWHHGYWGPQVGYYGGINYGYGYFGFGYVGGEWRDRHFAYNRAVTNVNINIVRNVYVNNNYRRETSQHISYNGGPNGVRVRPTQQQMMYERQRHFERTAEQERHDTEARNNRALRYNDNHGRPPVAATQRPGEFSGHDVVGSRPGGNNEFHRPANENRPRDNYPPNQPNNARPERPNYTPPRNQPRSEPGNPQPYERRGNQPTPHNEPAPRGNPHSQPQPEERPHNEQAPRGNGGGDHGRGGDHGGDNGDHGDHGRR